MFQGLRRSSIEGWGKAEFFKTPYDLKLLLRTVDPFEHRASQEIAGLWRIFGKQDSFP